MKKFQKTILFTTRDSWPRKSSKFYIINSKTPAINIYLVNLTEYFYDYRYIEFREQFLYIN